ncbi:mas-related G-protein coupled receptor member X1-like [Macrotis lagotis]|uniref:mas-related G-protein coupled receptor member X1-like n=1 Tax=Macrotis lagotis TaxID=92651 RepID=UPI003D69C450
MSPTSEQQEYVHDNRTERSMNGTFHFASPEEFHVVAWVQILSLLIALVGLVGNGLVLWLLGFCIQRNHFSVYILNLAGADALFLSCHFLMIINDFVQDFYFSLISKIAFYIRYLSYTVGLTLLATISTERCLSVLFPVWYRCHRPKHTSTTVCAVLWVLATLFEITFFVVCNHVDTKKFCIDFLIIEFVWFLLFTPLMCGSSLILLLRVQCSFQRQQPPRLYLLVLLTVFVFLLCGLPMGISGFILRFHRVSILLWLPWPLACVNSSANPIIYFFLGIQRHKRKRDPLKVVLQRALGDDQELEEETEDTPNITSPEASL